MRDDRGANVPVKSSNMQILTVIGYQSSGAAQASTSKGPFPFAGDMNFDKFTQQLVGAIFKRLGIEETGRSLQDLHSAISYVGFYLFTCVKVRILILDG